MNNKFREFLKNNAGYLVSILAAIGLLTLMFALAISGPKTDYKAQENQSKQEEQVPIPEYVAPTKPQQPEMNDMEKARSLIELSIKETVGDSKYEILEQDDQLILMLHLPEEDLAYVTKSDWRELATNAKYAQTAWQDVFRSAGLNVNFSVYVGDMDKDRVYLAANNGLIIYDVFNEQNDLQINSF
jgi:hypothetical protein